MNAKNVYLDTSTIVKRYVEEKGSQLADDIYARAEVGALRISFSMWNVGELIGEFTAAFRQPVLAANASHSI